MGDTGSVLQIYAGAPVEMVQKVLGHQYINTTLRYARLYDTTAGLQFGLCPNCLGERSSPDYLPGDGYRREQPGAR